MASEKIAIEREQIHACLNYKNVSNLNEVKAANRQEDLSSDIRSSLNTLSFRVFQTHFFAMSIFPRVQEPAAIRLLGFPSSRRFLGDEH